MAGVRLCVGVVGESQRVVHWPVGEECGLVRVLCGRGLPAGQVEAVASGGMPCMACVVVAARRSGDEREVSLEDLGRSRDSPPPGVLADGVVWS